MATKFNIDPINRGTSVNKEDNFRGYVDANGSVTDIDPRDQLPVFTPLK